MFYRPGVTVLAMKALGTSWTWHSPIFKDAKLQAIVSAQCIRSLPAVVYSAMRGGGLISLWTLLLLQMISIMCLPLAHSPPIFTAVMTIYYCPNMEEALRRAKKAGREPSCYFGGITLKSGRGDLLCIVTGRWWRNIHQYSIHSQGGINDGFQVSLGGQFWENAYIRFKKTDI